MMNRSLNNQPEMITRDTRTWIGVGLLLMSTTGFTLSLLIANMALKDGIDLHTSNAVRFIVTIIILFLFQKIGGKKLKLPPRERYISLCLGICVFMMGIGYLGATQYIPVSLAALVFYTYPFFVALVSKFTKNEPITLIRMLAILIAFIGLALALEVQSVAALDWRGILFGLAASIGATAFVIFSSLTLRTADPQAVNFHCLAAGTVLLVAFLLVVGGPVNEISPAGLLKLCGAGSGLLKLCGAGSALTLGYAAFFAGLEIIGPLKTSMLMNMEPVFTIIFAAVLLGERLSPLQIIGAGLVITGIILITGRVRNINHRS
jgi:drug/metabolite transporter (DMT)-like permease